ncbi:MAG: cyclopropane-fatty-acyl-phospholipid synthase family protein [Sphingobium sp.]
MKPTLESWNARYSEEGLAYGEGPNDFLAENAGLLTPGKCLCLAEGQGRNAVWLAGQGFTVTAVDQSMAGMARARDFAAERGVSIETIVADLSDFDLGDECWDSIISIFAHMPPVPRGDLHARVVRALKPGGTFLLEAYRPEHLDMSGTGGPGDAEMMMPEAAVRKELEGLDFVVARETERVVNEGKYHSGESAVTQIVARKPRGD